MADPKKEAEIARKVQEISRSINTHESQLSRLERDKSDKVRDLEREKNDKVRDFDQKINREREEIKKLNKQIADLKR
jgi:uncharacterized coiled-coil DUF342 family protein